MPCWRPCSRIRCRRRSVASLIQSAIATTNSFSCNNAQATNPDATKPAPMPNSRLSRVSSAVSRWSTMPEMQDSENDRSNRAADQGKNLEPPPIPSVYAPDGFPAAIVVHAVHCTTLRQSSEPRRVRPAGDGGAAAGISRRRCRTAPGFRRDRRRRCWRLRRWRW